MHLDVIVFKRNLALCLLFATLLTSDENNVNYVLTSMRVCIRRDPQMLDEREAIPMAFKNLISVATHHLDFTFPLPYLNQSKIWILLHDNLETAV